MGKEARGVYRGLRAQGAFEYLMSYGWAVLVVVVLGFFLYNVGVFNSTQTTVVSDFAFLKPLSVVVSSQDLSNAMLVFQVQNVGGKDFTVSSTAISSPSANCSYSLNFVQDSNGSIIATSHPFILSSGQEAKFTYWVNGTNCGAASNYDYKISFAGVDSFGIPQTDSGNIRGKLKLCQFPQNGLIGSWHLSEGYGNFTRDDSGSNRTGTLFYQPQWTVGKQGHGLQFNGSTAYVDVGNLSTSITDKLTMMAWFKPEKRQGTNYFSLSGIFFTTQTVGDCNTGTGFDIVEAYYPPYESRALRFLVSPVDFSCLLYPQYVMPFSNFGAWNHVALTYNGTTVSFYYNGALNYSNSTLYGNVAPPYTNWTIGKAWSSRFFFGLIDEVAVYNRVLSDSEIKAIYDCGLP